MITRERLVEEFLLLDEKARRLFGLQDAGPWREGPEEFGSG